MSHHLHHVEHGDGTPLILIHGFTVDHRLLLPLESSFVGRPGWRRIYLDLPGHGQTPAGSLPATADAIADTVAQAVHRLVGHAPFAICGNSFGGQIARDMVARFGDQIIGLALIAPVVRPRRYRRRGTHRTFHAPGTALDLGEQNPELVAEFTQNAIDHGQAAWTDFKRYVAPGLALHDRAFASRLLQSFDLTTAPESRFTTFDGAALTITGRQDDGVGYEDQFDLLNCYPRMSYVALDRAGHNVHLDQPDVTRALFGDWLDRTA